MSATSNPFGLIPVRQPIGDSRGNAYTIATGYGTQISKYQSVILNTNGTVTAGTAAADLLGVFMGCEYTDATGKRVVSNYWPASTTATNIVAWVVDDPATVYLVQADGAVAQTAVGDQADITNATANGNGFSQCTLASSLAGAGVQAQFRIVQIDTSIDNAAGDAFTKVLVQIARHQYVANKVAI